MNVRAKLVVIVYLGARDLKAISVLGGKFPSINRSARGHFQSLLWTPNFMLFIYFFSWSRDDAKFAEIHATQSQFSRTLTAEKLRKLYVFRGFIVNGLLSESSSSS